MLATVIGTIAATFSVTSFVPQAVRVIRTRNVKDLATSMWILNTSAFALWSVYGIFLRELPIIIPNVICFFLAGFILVMKLLPRRKREAVADKLTPITGAGTVLLR
jgi:MtN3 and saliva related transmembrane protein